MDLYDQLEEFHALYGAYRQESPAFPPQQISDLRLDLIREEVTELEEAVAGGDLIGVADALGDLLYVTAGAMLAFGVDGRRVLAEIHRSNLSKLGDDGKPILGPTGKVLKGPGFSPPDIAGVLGLRA